MSRFLLNLMYDGTNYCGWQKQNSSTPSIQKTIENAIYKITKEKVIVTGSGRTDSGVHALEQIAHFDLKKEWEITKLKKAINAMLPISIRIKSIAKKNENFHANKNVLMKQYGYYFQQGPLVLPSKRLYSVWIHKNLDINKMNKAIKTIIGIHDFLPFQSSGSSVKTTTREIFEAEVLKININQEMSLSFKDMFFIKLRILGSGFLKQMVRSISGTLLEIGEGKRNEDSFTQILKKKDRKLTGKMAPPRGLWLEKVWYK